jgi:hypothetical protein
MKNLFKTGNTFGHAGRPRGSRNKMAQAFFDALHKIMVEEVAALPEPGMTKVEESLRNLYRREPLQFVKTILHALPPTLEVTSVASELSDEELALCLTRIKEALAAPKAPLLIEVKPDETAH